MRVEFRQVDWPFAIPFRIAYSVSAVAETVQVQLTDGQFVGRGESLGVSYHGETVAAILAQLETVKFALSKGISRAELATLLPPGGARNAADCALWDMEAKRTGKRAWELAGLRSVEQVTTDCTIGLDSPDAMAHAAAALHQYSVLKLKLCGQEDLARAVAVRNARPDADLIVDANQTWSEELLRDLAPKFAKIGIKLIEQPLPVGQDEMLSGYKSPIPLCADESCQTAACLRELTGKYEYVNIKLDKTGGLTEGLHLAREAARQGFRLMVGCMAGSSLSMAPAFIIAQLCDFVDLDGPLLAAGDIANPIRYEGGRMHPPERALWG